jgi:hypothetical protein
LKEIKLKIVSELVPNYLSTIAKCEDMRTLTDTTRSIVNQLVAVGVPEYNVAFCPVEIPGLDQEIEDSFPDHND